MAGGVDCDTMKQQLRSISLHATWPMHSVRFSSGDSGVNVEVEKLDKGYGCGEDSRIGCFCFASTSRSFLHLVAVWVTLGNSVAE